MRTNEKLWESIKKKLKKGDKGGRKNTWSARKAQLAVKLYKKQGGKYKNKKSKNNSLVKWTNQKWKTKSGKPSLETGERYLPEKAIKYLTHSEYEKTSNYKRKDLKKGRVYSKQPIFIARKVRKFRFGKMKMKETIKQIKVSNIKGKKYTAFVYNPKTKKTRLIHFGATGYEQYSDKLKHYKTKNHNDKKRRKMYFLRHSGVETKTEALKKEKRKSNGLYNAKILSHKFLW